MIAEYTVSFSSGATKDISIRGATLTQPPVELHTTPPRTQFPQWVCATFVRAFCFLWPESIFKIEIKPFYSTYRPTQVKHLFALQFIKYKTKKNSIF